MSFYYFRQRVAATLRPICLGLSLIACGIIFIPGTISALDAVIRVESTAPPKDLSNIENILEQWREVLAFGDISRHHRFAEKKSAIWWALIEYKDVGQLDKALTKKEKKAIKKWLNKNKRNLDMQLAYHAWLYQSGEQAVAIKRVKNLAQKFPEYSAFSKQYRLWTKKTINLPRLLDAESQTFLEAR